MDAPKLCYIEWIDINNNTGPWVVLPDETQPSPCFSIGWLVQECESSVTVSATYSDSDDERHALLTTAIPRCCVTRFEVIDAENVMALWAK